MLQSEFEKRARAMADGDEEPLTENEKHALRNSTVTDDGRHVCGKTRRDKATAQALGKLFKIYLLVLAVGLEFIFSLN